MPTPVATRSEMRIRGRSLGGTAGSNPAGGMDASLVLSGRGLCDDPDPSYRGILPSVCR